MLKLPKPVEKRGLLGKRRFNQIGESFSSAKQLNEPTRIDDLRENLKRKAEEFETLQAKKKAKKEEEDPVGKVLHAFGYLKEASSAVTVSAMKSFLKNNTAQVQMPRTATHAKRADQLAFLKAVFADRPGENWAPALKAPAQADPEASKTMPRCCKMDCRFPALVLRQCSAQGCEHFFHHICTTHDLGKFCKCCNS